MFNHEKYAQEIFAYSVIIEKMKVMHSILFLVIGVQLIRTSAASFHISESHYRKVLVLSLAVTLLFVIPVLFIIFLSYNDVGSSYNSMNWSNQT